MNELRNAKDVLRYFLRNPHAADTLDGVARWRIRQEQVRYNLWQVDQALRWLVEQGLLVRETAGGTATFRLNRDRVTDAERFLDTWPNHFVPPPAGEVMACAVAWIDATLLLHHRCNPPTEHDLPGLTRSYSSIERTLQPRVHAVGVDLSDVDQALDHLMEAIDQADPDAEPLAALSRHLRLGPVELQALLLCLAPEIDAKYQAIYGVLNDDLSRRHATLGLIGAVLRQPLAVRRALEQGGSLTRHRLLELGSMLPHADEPLRLDLPLVEWILGDWDALPQDPRMRPFLRARPWAGAQWLHRPGDVAAIQRLARRLAAENGESVWMILSGTDADGWRALLEAAAVQSAVPIVRVSVASLVGLERVDVEEVGDRLCRMVNLLRAVPVLDLADAADEASASAVATIVATSLRTTTGPVVLLVSDAARLVGVLPAEHAQLLHRERPDATAMADVFAAAARSVGVALSDEEAEQLATTFPLSLAALDDAIRLVALDRPTHEPAERVRQLTAACRRVARPNLPRFARRLEPAFTLDDVVLPATQRGQFHEIIANVSLAPRVLNGWGFGAQLPYGRGVTALFFGPSGTGKTMAAQAIAHALHTDVCLVDLSQVISKFIGESEKNLDLVFSDAERAGAVLLFDEADALFGKRSEVKDAHDRYANIEVAYLLQRMEAYTGLAILTTNQRQNLDPAFLRRLRFVLEFPKPDAEARERIWHLCLPATAPLGAIDFRFLARRLDLTGGNIRQITLRAAFLAAREQASAIGMRHIVAATRAELVKLGMLSAERELAAFEASAAAA